MIIERLTPNWTAHIFLREIHKKLDSKNTLVVDATWMSNHNEIETLINNWLNENKNNNAILLNFFDPKWQDVKFNSDRIRHLGCESFWFWAVVADKFFTNYSVNEVMPTQFKYDFLCYQRKVNPPREYLYQLLSEKKNGIITIGNVKNNFNDNLKHNIGFNDVSGDENVYAPNDIFTLGDLGIWNSSFLNIISETVQDYRKDIFLSEKTLKPIIGMRPFISYGHPETTDFLKSHGFECFDEDFGYKASGDYEVNAKNISEIVDKIDNKIFDKLMPKLIHNKNNLKKVVEREWNKLETFKFL